MRADKLEEIKGLDIKVLSDRVIRSKKQLEELFLDKNMNKLKDLKAIYKKRKDIAQLLTVLRQKKLFQELDTKVKSKESGKEIKV